MKVALVPTLPTAWRRAGRLLGRAELSPESEACEPWVAALEPLLLAVILHAPDELSARTAQVLAGELGIATRAVPELVEVDLGLWAGLTDADLRSRFSRAHRGLRDDPLRVSPPGGEPLEQAAGRIERALRRHVLRRRGTDAALVLRPLALAMARCILTGEPLTDLWDTAAHIDSPVVVEPQPAAKR